MTSPIDERARELTADWIELNHTTDDPQDQYIDFESRTVTLDGYFSKDQLKKVLEVMEVIEREFPE